MTGDLVDHRIMYDDRTGELIPVTTLTLTAGDEGPCIDYLRGGAMSHMWDTRGAARGPDSLSSLRPAGARRRP
jgi:hypothetical protein